jgi:hypothetical protein
MSEQRMKMMMMMRTISLPDLHWMTHAKRADDNGRHGSCVFREKKIGMTMMMRMMTMRVMNHHPPNPPHPPHQEVGDHPLPIRWCVPLYHNHHAPHHAPHHHHPHKPVHPYLHHHPHKPVHHHLLRWVMFYPM